MTNYPMGWRVGRICTAALIAAMGLAAPARVDAQVTSYAYVLRPFASELIVIDTRTRAVVGTGVPVGTTSFSAVPTPDGRRVYVGGFGNGTVRVLDAVTNTFLASSITVQNNPYGLGISPDGRKVYVANSGSSSMSVIDVATNTATNVAAGGVSPATPTVSPDGTKVYLPLFGSNTLAIFDTATGTMIGAPLALPGCANPLYATFTLNGQRAYISCYIGDALKVIDVATTTVVDTITGLDAARDSVLTRDGTKLFVGSFYGGNNLYVVNVATNTLLPTLTPAASPASVAITPDGKSLYTTNAEASTVSVIDIASMAVVGTIPITPASESPQSHARFTGPNIITTTCTGCGPLIINGDAALTPLGFDRFVNFNTGIISLTGDWTTTRTLSILAGGGTINTNGHNATINAKVINDGMLTKTGLGALTLTDASTHTGGSRVQMGTLFVNAAHPGPVLLQAGLGSTLGGNGTIGTITATGGTIAPGVNGPAILHATNVTMTPAVTLAFQLNGPAAGTGYDQLEAIAATLGGATLDLQLNFLPMIGHKFTIVENATGTFAGRPEGQVFTLNGVALRLTYHGGSGSDVELEVIGLPPTITGLTDQTILAGNTLGPLAFTVGDDLTPAGDLVVTATSSNQSLLPNAVIVLGGSGAARTLTASPIPGASGTTVITVTVTDGGGLTAQQAFTLTVQPRPVYYLSEGSTGGFFSTDLLIANPNTTDAPVEVRFFKDDGTTVLHTLTLAATSRVTIHVNEIAGLETAAFSTAVASNGNVPLIVERTMWWDANGYGAHTEKASSAAGSQWYFAEGSQGFFHTYFLLLNPHPVPTVAHVTYLLEGEPAVQRDYPMVATSRLTVDPGADAALVNRSFGAVVTFDLPGMAERAMYFGDTPFFNGGHGAAGVTAPATSWFLAEGATGSFFDTFVLIANPNTDAAALTITYLPEGGSPIVKTKPLAGNQRLTINIATEDAALANAAVSTRVESDRPIVVERAQYWPHGNWHEAHSSAGETAAGTKWGLAEGRVGGGNNAQTYILVANPGTSPADLTATFLRENGTTVVKTFTVQPTSRFTIAVNGASSDVPELANESFGTTITSTQPVIIERALYTDAGGVMWAAGTNATATRLP
jgi:YVTN family beta-propeller protein/autotransporter-associated beta strand protein